MEICVQEGNSPWVLASGAGAEGSGTWQSQGRLNWSYEDPPELCHIGEMVLSYGTLRYLANR